LRANGLRDFGLGRGFSSSSPPATNTLNSEAFSTKRPVTDGPNRSQECFRARPTTMCVALRSRA
jgi:hypothetical protein